MTMPCATKHHRPQRTNIARHRAVIPQAANTAVQVAVPRAVATLQAAVTAVRVAVPRAVVTLQVAAATVPAAVLRAVVTPQAAAVAVPAVAPRAEAVAVRAERKRSTESCAPN